MEKDFKLNIMALSSVFTVAIALILTLYIAVITTTDTKISGANFDAMSAIQFATPNKTPETVKPVIVENKNLNKPSLENFNKEEKKEEVKTESKTEEIKKIDEKKDSKDSKDSEPKAIPYAGLKVNFAIGIVLAALVVFSKISMIRYNRINNVAKKNIRK